MTMKEKTNQKMTMFSGFFRRIANDFTHKELIPLKILFFIQASTLLVLYPYLTIHMRELGINVEETAVISAVIPLIGIIMPPLAGMVADKIGNFKLLLCLFSTLGGFASLLLLLVPVGRITVTFPSQALLTIGCHETNLVLSLSEDVACNASLTNNITTEIESCGFLCEIEDNFRDVPELLLSPESSQSFLRPTETLPNVDEHVIPDVQPESGESVYMKQIMKKNQTQTDQNEITINPVQNAQSYVLSIKVEGKEISIMKYNLSKTDMPKEQSKMDALEDRTMRHNLNYKTAIRRISKYLYYLPSDIYSLGCFKEDETEESTDFLLSHARFTRMKRQAINSQYCNIFNEIENTINTAYLSGSLNLAINRLNDSYPFLLTDKFQITNLTWNESQLTPICPSNTLKMDEVSATANIPHPERPHLEQQIKFPKCEPRCLLTSNRAKVCSNLKKEVVFDPVLTFWTYLIIRVFIGIIGGTTFAMFEGAVIAVLREQRADYGLQRIYASIGGMISSPLSGMLIDYASQGKDYTDFRPAFYLYAALKLLGGGLMLLINLEFKAGAETVVADVIAVIKKIEIIALLVSSFILGIAWGYIESFLFWLLQDMGGSSSLMGITYTVGGLAGIPLLAMSGPIINKIGHANVIFIGFIFYAIRLLGYSLIYNPWHSLFFEAMESITSSLSFTAAVTFMAKLSTTTTDSSVQGLLGGLYYGVGKGAGGLIGGFLMKTFTARPTFQIFSVFTFFMGCVYFLFNQFYMRHRQEQGNEICPKDNKPKENVTLTVISLGNKLNSEINSKEGQDNPAFDKS